jgi:NAD(P)-dependent dehydrogenase (short-subunit alcohol dehydrogenase family)
MAKVAVVTGATAGVGRATAIELSRRGYDVGLLARGRAGLDATCDDVRSNGREVVAVPTDVADFDQVDEAASTVERELGPIDLWVNNAMTTFFAPSWDVPPDDFERAVQVTFLGQVWGTKAALARMRPRDRGAIVDVGSALAFIGIPLQSAYCASKFACRGFFESTRAELLHEGSNVRMSIVHLPAVNTPQFDWCATTLDHHPMPVPPIYEPELAARLVADVAEDGRRSKVLGSWNTFLVAAAQLAPGFGNHFAARGAWETQLTDDRIDPDRPVNLRHPVDDTTARDAHGSFDDQAGGFLDPAYLKTLPSTARTFVQASVGTARELRDVWSRRLAAARS